MAAGALAALLVIHHTGLPWATILRAAAGAALMYFPAGDLLLPRARGVLGRGERIALAFCVGYPVSATLAYACALAGMDRRLWIAWTLLAIAALARRVRWAREEGTPGPTYGV